VQQLRTEPELYGMAMNLLGYFHWFRGDYEGGFNTIFEALRHVQAAAVENHAWLYYALGVFYFDTRDYENSRINYQKAYDMFRTAEMAYQTARAASGLASIAILEERTDEAGWLLEFASGKFRELGHHSGLSRTLNDMGLLEKKKGNTGNAIKYLHEAITLREAINHAQGLVTSYSELGEILLGVEEKSREALPLLEKALRLAEDLNAYQKQMRLHKLLYDYYKRQSDNQKALEHFEKFYELRTKILSDEAANKMKRLQTQFEKENAEKQTEIERLRNTELRTAKAIIEQKNKDITDSINYARRIQTGMLPTEELMQAAFADHFIFFRPKDIVSGDFYWTALRHDRAVVAIADCTGHGVPGAFMSMLGATLLNECAYREEMDSAADMLDYLNSKLPLNLRSKDGEHLRDGMDIALCVINRQTGEMQYAGANNPCWIVRNGVLTEIKADKQPVSAGTDFEKRPFTNHRIQLQENDCVYLFTDGFADQFGGEREKKFGYRRFKELVVEASVLPHEAQQSLFASRFSEWRADLEQVDDVCVLGFRAGSEK
jgi:serine phosphatase RsbU (regulator of sigma subunit)